VTHVNADQSQVFGRGTKGRLPVIAGGEGCFLIDRSGKRYLDGSGGAAVSCLGHGDREVLQAIKGQLDTIAFAHTGFFTTSPAEGLAQLLIDNAPPGLERVYLLAGGSEATEAALKLARQYHLERGEPQRRRIVARRQSYHGNTLGALAVGGNPARRKPFEPLLMEVSHIEPCYAYREARPDESPEDYGRRAADALKAEFERLGPDTVMAFVAETVVGATLGAVPPAPGYLARIREICDEHGVLLILDEVMCGMGRTGHLFACAEDGVAPDILTIAKGLGGGYQPIGAMLCSGAIYEAVAEGSGSFKHGHTYMGHPTACAAGHAVLSAILSRGLPARVIEQGERLDRALRTRLGQHSHVGDIRGRGLFRGVELVEDRDTKAPFAAERLLAPRIKAAAFEAGLICYPMQGTADGTAGDHVLLAPPFIISDDEIDLLVDRLAGAIDAALTA